MYWLSFKKPQEPPVTGLVLPGGGARNAYQAGVLKAIAEMLPEDSGNPFPVICGSSAGAVNAAVLASNANRFHKGVKNLNRLWENIHVEMVFKSDPWTAFKSGLQWGITFVTGQLHRGKPRSVLDNSPLRARLKAHVRLGRVQRAIDSGDLRALAITACGYTSGSSHIYYQGVKDLVPWERTRRKGHPEKLTLDHLMASVAIPVLFPAVKLGNEYFGDGSMRENAPLSPALHLGANRLLIIGVRNPKPDVVPEENSRIPYPSFAQITGYIFDTLFMDTLDADIERLNRINHTINQTREKRVELEDTTLRPIEFLMISPSRDVREIVARHTHCFPRSVRLLLKGIGALTREGRPLLSYLLFESSFCKELIELGYKDGMDSKEQILQLLKPGSAN